MKKLSLLPIGLFCCFMASAQIIDDSLLIEGHYRAFHFKKPQPATSNASLVFIMHGSGGRGMGIRNSALKLESKADAENFIVVYPDGYKNYWNECRKAATSVANLENINENAFFSAMIDYFKTKYKINSNKVFAAGMSGGGHMAYKLAITMPDKFKAITAVVANLPDTSNMDCSESRKPVAVMIINGTADPTNPYEGGEMQSSGVVLGKVRSTDRTFNYWATIDGYTGNPVKTNLPDTDPADGKTIEQYTYKTKGKPEVTLLKVINGRHEHPTDIDAYVEAWEFFKRQAREK